MDTLPPGARVAGYTILELLRQGGSGVIYVARDEKDGEKVALKVPDRSYLGDIPSWERFRREAALAKRLHHPMIANIREASDSPEQPFLAVEFVDGTDLQEYIQKHGPLAIDQATTIAIQLCETVQYIHDQRVIHRDLKPANIMLGPDGIPKLVDFGIAKPLDMKRVTWKGLSKTFGTPSYMAPEQVQGGQVSPATDVYALGTILYEMIAGRPPFEGDNAFQVMGWQVNKQAPPLKSARPETPEWLDAIVRRALEKKPQHRYHSAAEMQRDLQHQSAPEPIAEDAEQPSAPRFIWILLLASFGVIVLVVIAAIIHSHFP